MKSIELVTSKSSKVAPTFGQLQGLMSELNGIDPWLAKGYAISHQSLDMVGLDDRQILARVVTDDHLDVGKIASALRTLSFPDGVPARIEIQYVLLWKSVSTLAARR